MKFGELNLKKIAVDTLYEIAGAIVFSIGIYCFTAPNEIAPGGVSGLSTLANHLFGIPLGTASLILNLPLLFLALRFLGRAFTIRTFKTVAILSLVMDIVMPLAPVYEGNGVLASLFGGVCMGAGLALVFMRGSTTGGTDIAIRLFQLRWPHMAVGRLLFIIDLFVLVLAAFVFMNIETLLYGMIAIFTSARVLDSVLYGMDSGRMLLIMSKKHDELAQAILQGVDRGVTFLQSEGAFSGQPGKVLLCAMRNNQYHRIKAIVSEIDPEAFLITTEASEILGSGFYPIDVKR